MIHLFSTQHSEVLHMITEEARPSMEYWSLLVLSTIIATLGVMLDNSAIVIGSMILSPLLWPIIGVALGTVRNDKKLWGRSLMLLGASLVLAIGISTLLSLAFFRSIFELNSAIGTRINPTFLDFLVAIATGIAAPIIIVRNKLTTAAAGVAIAASLLPPLVIVGIGISVWHLGVASGSSILFLTNLTSILAASIGIFFLSGFRRYRKEASETPLKIGIGVTIFTLILLGVQLAFSLGRLVQQEVEVQAVETGLESYLTSLSSSLRVDRIEVSAPLMGTRGEPFRQVTTVLRAPSEFRLTYEQQAELERVIAEALDTQVSLDLRLLPQVTVDTPDVVASRLVTEERKLLERIFVEAVATHLPLAAVDTITLDFNETTASYQATLLIPEHTLVTEEDTQAIEADIALKSERDVTLALRFLTVSEPVARINITELEQELAQLYEAVDLYDTTYFPVWSMQIRHVEIRKEEDTYTLDISLDVEDRNGVEGKLNSLKNFLLTEFAFLEEDTLSLTWRIFTYETLE